MFSFEKTLSQLHNVRKFHVDAILLGENKCNKKRSFKGFTVFSVGLWLESGKLCKNNDHKCVLH